MTVSTNQTARLAGSDISREGVNYEGAMLTNRQTHYRPLLAACTLKFSAFWNFGQSALQKSGRFSPPPPFFGSKKNPTEVTHDSLSHFHLTVPPRWGQWHYTLDWQVSTT
jgi:hypothetical protein